MPFRNAAPTLRRAMESILAQSYRDFELIMINDCSGDDGEKIIKDYKDKRIRLINFSSCGLVGALNTGLKSARGKYIARMDADDFSHPDRLKKQYNFLENHPETGLVSTCVTCIGDFSASEGFYHYIGWNNRLRSHREIFLNRFVESPVIHPTMMIRSSMVKKYGGYREGPFPEDYEFWLRLLHQGVRFYKLDDILVDWYDSPDRLSRTEDRYNPDAFYSIKTYYLRKWLCKKYKKIPPILIWGIGRSVLKKSKWLMDHGMKVVGYIDVINGRNRKFHEKPVIYYMDIPRDHLILSFVSDRSGRLLIHEYLLTHSFVEGKDFYMMA
ncbi:MAG: glycosyltransferase [Cyclobacteriaceae bacterium]|nr:glycosyltransferase [Cyclobacteriaceae bacterium]